METQGPLGLKRERELGPCRRHRRFSRVYSAAEAANDNIFLITRYTEVFFTINRTGDIHTRTYLDTFKFVESLTSK